MLLRPKRFLIYLDWLCLCFIRFFPHLRCTCFTFAKYSAFKCLSHLGTCNIFANLPEAKQVLLHLAVLLYSIHQMLNVADLLNLINSYFQCFRSAVSFDCKLIFVRNEVVKVWFALPFALQDALYIPVYVPLNHVIFVLLLSRLRRLLCLCFKSVSTAFQKDDMVTLITLSKWKHISNDISRRHPEGTKSMTCFCIKTQFAEVCSETVIRLRRNILNICIFL